MNSCSSAQIFSPSISPNTSQIPSSQIFDQPPSPDFLRVELLEKVDIFTNRTFKNLMIQAFNQAIPYYIAFSLGRNNQLRPYDAFNLIATIEGQNSDPNGMQNFANYPFNPNDNFRIYRVTKGNPGTLKFFSRFSELNNNCDHNLKLIYAAAPHTVRPKVIAQSSFYRAMILNKEDKKIKWLIRGSNHGSYKSSLALFVIAQEKNFNELAKMALLKSLEQVQSKNNKNSTEIAKIKAIARSYINELTADEISRFKI
ncbi:hypothetical protein [Criblamydia sequanensis]|uniref:Uncharacterized protein n=1 Tax=Candidatus Criblamydia sequanensis CRIB-18 TaxID=1437425 RepID=A0A090CZY5_9BACT|nr:hypothetical protein [Criblamydia sequanensis]CDR33105.1 hypothetical protein CSEC_0266 [Criblamydia sequanensis CRIB-18]